MAQDSFIFGGTSGLTYEELVRRRAIAAALAGRQKGFPKTKGEGLTYLGDSFAEAMGELALRRKEQEYKREQDKIGSGAPKGGSYVPGSQTSYDQKDEKPFPKAASDDAYDKDRPTTKVDTPVTPVTPVPQTAPVAAPSVSDFPSEAPVAPWPVSEADPSSFSDRFAAASAPPPDAIPVQTASVAPPVQTVSAPPPQISSDMQAMFFSPQMAKSELAGGRTADMSPVQPPPEPVTLPTETRDIPLPMGDPRTTGGVRSTMEAVASRGGMTPTAIAGLQRNVRDESGFNPNLRHPDQPNFSGEAHYAHGLYQEGGDEWNNYVKWLDQKAPGSDWRDPKLQTQFLMDRMQDPSRPDYNRTFANMNAAPNSGVAADQFLRGYLKPASQHLAARSAEYLRGEGDQNYASQAVTGGGGGGATVATYGPRTGSGNERMGGAPLSARDAVTAALLQQNTQPQQVQQPPTQEEASADSRLLEAVGGGRKPGSPFYPPTAALGRAGVTSDVAQPGLSPMGSLGGSGVDQSVEARRNAISDALQNQPVPVPEVPPENPTQPGTSSLSPTTASLPPSISGVTSSDITAVPPMGATAQAGIPLAPPVGYGNMRVAQEPGPAMPAPRPPDTSQGIAPAPNAPPSAMPIPPERMQEFPKYGGPPPEPKPFGPSENQKYWEQFLSHPDPRVRQKAEHTYTAEETFRKAAETRAWEKYKNDRETYEANVRAERDFNLKKDERELETRIKRLTIEKEIAAAQQRPKEAEKLQGEIDNAQATLEKSRRDLAKPEYFDSQGQRLQSSYDPKTRTFGPYTPAPGSPPPTVNESQAKSIQFVNRVTPDLDSLERDQNHGIALTNKADALKAAASMHPDLANVVVSNEYRRARNSANNWGAAFLTMVSGAAVSPSEASRNLPALLPQVGDTLDDLKDKSKRRRDYTDAVAQSSGPAAMAVIQRGLDRENADYKFKAEGKLEPVKVNSPQDAMSLNPGRKIIMPDGTVGTVPRR